MDASTLQAVLTFGGAALTVGLSAGGAYVATSRAIRDRMATIEDRVGVVEHAKGTHPNIATRLTAIEARLEKELASIDIGNADPRIDEVIEALREVQSDLQSIRGLASSALRKDEWADHLETRGKAMEELQRQIGRIEGRLDGLYEVLHRGSR